jgi:hypothetical protein
MRRIFCAGAFALPFLLLSAGDAQAQCGPHGCSGGPGSGYYQIRQDQAGPQPFMQMFQFAMRMYPLIHSHGPLYNYGPYTGYYPFEPYGPWTSGLQYTGPEVGGHGHGFGPGPFHNWHGLNGSLGGGHGSHCWKKYSLATFHNVGLRINPFTSHCKGCSASVVTPNAEVVKASVDSSTPVVAVIRER